MVSFTDLPYEMQGRIFEFALVDKHCVEYWNHSDGTFRPVRAQLEWTRLEPSFSTALFRVNKAISKHSLEVFHKKNKFVSLQSSSDELAEQASSLIPMKMVPILYNKRKRRVYLPKPGSLLASGGMSSSSVQYEPRGSFDFELYTMVFAVKHLPAFARLLNSPWSEHARGSISWKPILWLDFQFQAGEYSFHLSPALEKIAFTTLARLQIRTDYLAGEYRPNRLAIEGAHITGLADTTIPADATLAASQMVTTRQGECQFWLDEAMKRANAGLYLEANNYFELVRSVLRQNHHHHGTVEAVERFRAAFYLQWGKSGSFVDNPRYGGEMMSEALHYVNRRWWNLSPPELQEELTVLATQFWKKDEATRCSASGLPIRLANTVRS